MKTKYLKYELAEDRESLIGYYKKNPGTKAIVNEVLCPDVLYPFQRLIRDALSRAGGGMFITVKGMEEK